MINILRNEVTSLNKRVTKLENERVIHDSHIAILTNTSDLLRRELDNAEQYSRRSCIVMTGVPATKNDTQATHSTNVKKILQQHAPEVLQDLDKLHPIGPVSKDGKQSMILKFSKHSTVKNLYKKRKQLGNGMSLRPSITSTRKRTLKTCRDKIANEDSLLHKAVEFVFPDIDGDLNDFLETTPSWEKCS